MSAAAAEVKDAPALPPSPLLHFFKSVLAGGFASTIAKTAVAPGERVRLILQTHSLRPKPTAPPAPPAAAVAAASSSVRAAAPPAAALNVLQLVRHIASPAQGGVWALWRGNLANCLRSFPSYALRFSIFDRLRGASPPEFRHSFGGALLLGALSGATTTVVTHPLDVIRTKLAVDHGAHAAATTAAATAPATATQQRFRYRGIVHCVTETVREGGPRALYRGLAISVVEIMPYTAISLGGYDLAKQYLASMRGGDQPPSTLGKLAVGWVVGLVASLVCYPLDTVKRHVMLAERRGDAGEGRGRSAGGGGSSGSAAAGQSSAVLPTFRRIYAGHGLAGFYRGAAVNAVKSAPAAAIALVANDALRQLLGVQDSPRS